MNDASARPTSNDNILAPASVVELQHMIASHSRVLAVGNQTKSALCRADDATLVSLSRVQGIIEYEPSEFTFTALAGTTLAEITSTLAQRRQYLPFDPLLVQRGATLGGCVASGLSGPGRFRFGGIRDFILGVELITGDSAIVKAGGKVVKNAAGFDIPKLLVGSCGRLGVLTTITMKVFPQPPTNRCLQVHCHSHAQAAQRIAMLAASRYELDAIEYCPRDKQIVLRITGPEPANESIANAIQSQWNQDVTELPSPDAFWGSLRELEFAGDDQPIVKVATTLASALSLQTQLDAQTNVQCHWSIAGNSLWVALSSPDDIERLQRLVVAQRCRGMVVQGQVPTPWLGTGDSFTFQQMLKQAIDPANRFPDN